MPLPAMATTLSVRENAILGRARILQMVFVIIIIIVTAFNISSWRDLDCKPPSKIAYNLAAAVVSFIVFVYLLASTGPKHAKATPWHQFGQLGLDAFLLILWIAAVATSFITCQEACDACKSYGLNYDQGCGYYVDFGGERSCTCYFAWDDYCDDSSYGYSSYTAHKRAILDARNVFEKRASSHSSYRGVKYSGKLALNVIMMVLCLGALAGTIYLIFHSRRSPNAGSGIAPAPTVVPVEPKHDTAQQPVSGGIPPTQPQQPIPNVPEQQQAQGYGQPSPPQAYPQQPVPSYSQSPPQSYHPYRPDQTQGYSPPPAQGYQSPPGHQSWAPSPIEPSAQQLPPSHTGPRYG